MGIPLREIIKQLPLEEQKEIEKRSAEFLAEEIRERGSKCDKQRLRY